MDLLAVFKLEDYADEASINLPYGLQRRLEIARALATHPRLLLLDEPAAGMNPNEIILLMDFIRWIRKEFDLTIILIEHQMRLVMGICERLKVLDFGATIAEGTPSEIRNNPKVLEAYLGEEGGAA
jgi:branched-chain amino acid transport system ATP-binding protein